MTTIAASPIARSVTPMDIRDEVAAPVCTPAGDVHVLTSALARGDEGAFHEFHARYFDRLLRYLFVVTRGDDEAAREALQETFTRVARHVRPFECEDVFWSWLTVVARSAAQDAGRKRSRYWRLLERYAAFWRQSCTPEADATSERLEALLNETLKLLDPGDRALIDGKYFRDSSVRALAAEFALTEKAVESRLTRARRLLRAELSKRLRHESND